MTRQDGGWGGIWPQVIRPHPGRPIAAVAPALAFLAAFMLLGACTQLEASRTFVDSAIVKLEKFDDRIIEKFEKAEQFLAEEQKRIRRAKCRMPHTALVRHARSSPERAAAVERDCNLKVTGISVVSSVVPEPQMVEPRERLSFPSGFPEVLRERSGG